MNSDIKPTKPDFPNHKNNQVLIQKILEIFLMFGACLLICHVPGIIHTTLGHF
jgi:hypothetical protein